MGLTNMNGVFLGVVFKNSGIIRRWGSLLAIQRVCHGKGIHFPYNSWRIEWDMIGLKVGT